MKLNEQTLVTLSLILALPAMAIAQGRLPSKTLSISAHNEGCTFIGEMEPQKIGH